MLQWKRAPAYAILFCATAFPAAAQDRAEYLRAAAAVRQGHPAEAIPILEKILAGAPRDLQTRNLFGIALMSAGRKAEAAAQFEQALAIDANFAPALKNLGIDEMELGRAEEARSHFTRFLQGSPADPVVHFYLAELEYSQKRFTDALAHYAQSGGMHLKDSQPLLHFAGAAMETRDAESAVGALAQLSATAPPEAHFQAGLLLARAEKYAEAAAQFRQAQGGSVDPYQVRIYLGAALALTGRMSDAEKVFHEAARLSPESSVAYVAVAMVQMQSGKVEEAVRVLRERRAAAPEDYLVNRYLGEALSREGLEPGSAGEKEALAVLESAVRVNPSAASARVLLGKLLFARGDLDRAAAQFEEALRLDPGDVSPAYQLALIYRKRGNMARADELFDLFAKAKKSEPGNAAARDLLNAIGAR